MITPSISKMAARSIIFSSLFSRFKPRPTLLGCLIVLWSSDVQEVIRDSKRRHSTNNVRQHVKSQIDRTRVRNYVQQGPSGQHQTGERQITHWSLRLFDKPTDQAIVIHLNYRTSRRATHFVHTYRS